MKRPPSKVVILGFGKIARDAHAPAWARAAGAGRAEIEAIYEPTEAGCAAAAKHFPQAKVFCADARQAFNDGVGADVVDVCTPGHLHHELVLAALHRGQHVLVEKPLAHTRAAVEEMISSQNGAVVQVCQTLRLSPPVIRFKAAFRAGSVGRVTRIQITHHARHILSEAEWVTRSRPDGVIFENAIHFLDLAHYLIDASQEARIDAVRFQEMPHRRLLTGFELFGIDGAGRQLSIDYLQDSLVHSALTSRVYLSATGADAELRFYPDGFRLMSGIIDPVHDLAADSLRLLALAKRVLGRRVGPTPHDLLVEDLLGSVSAGGETICPPRAVLPGVCLAEALSRRWSGILVT